jgi:hypothetical protein
MHGSGAHVASHLVSGFLAVFFLHAGLDRVLDRKGNLMRLRVAFDQSPMRRPIGAWLTLLTLAELGAGILSAAGFLTLFFARSPHVAFAGAAVGAVSLVWNFFGLRLGRDYTAASATVPYFVTCLVALVLLGG